MHPSRSGGSEIANTVLGSGLLYDTANCSRVTKMMVGVAIITIVMAI